VRTTDGGTTWQVGRVLGAETVDFRDVEAFSSDEAYLLAAGPGEQSRIYKTSDAGKKWSLQFTNKDPKGFFDCMAFWDRDRGIAVGDPVDGKFQLIKTENGGRDWKLIAPEKLPPAIEGEGAFAASGTCIATQGEKNVWFVTGGSKARIFRSSDAGESWGVVETPIFHGPASAGIFSVAFRDAKHGVIAGGDYKEPSKELPSLAFSNDGGKSWNLSPLPSQHYFSAIAFDPADPKRIFAVGTSQYASAGSVRSKGWQVFVRPNTHPAGLPAELNSIAISRGNSNRLVVGAKGAIFVIDDVCQSCSKK
jgi:photosystem II stability/assembly factor-like uncharacterized protein